MSDKAPKFKSRSSGATLALDAARALSAALDAVRIKGGDYAWNEVCKAHDALKAVL